MSDMYCSRCREPWDMDCLHDEVKHRNPDNPWFTKEKPEGFTWEDNGLWYNPEVYQEYYQPIQKEFRTKGCAALTSYTNGCYAPATYADDIGAVYEIMGDDLDGAIGFMEDMRIV